MRKKSELRSYQQRVATHLYEHDATLAVLKMGAGKTISTLTAIGELIDDQVIRHALIIAPKRVATLVWPDEIDSWQHTMDLEYDVLDGSPVHRKALFDKVVHRDITIIGIDNVQWLVAELLKLPADSVYFDCLVIDETSRLKDPKSKRAKALAGLAKQFRIKWGLTGTPAPNSLLDLHTPMKILVPGLWPRSFYKWRQTHFYPVDFNAYQWKVLPGQDAKILADAASVSITLNEGDMPDLPDLSILIDEVQLPPDARAKYRTMEQRLFAQLEKEGKSVLAMSRAVATGKLAQLSNGFLYDEDGAAGAHTVHAAKEQWLSDLVTDLGGEPCLLVYEFKEDLQMIRRLFGNIPHLGAGVSDKNAAESVDLWNAGKLPLFAIHPASAGHGLNLQAGGSRMAWIAPCWSAEYWSQTVARIHRPGQAAHCMIHVCAASFTVDQLKLLRVQGKLSAEQAFESYLAASQALAAA